MTNHKAKLLLEDGTSVAGYGFGYESNTEGEVVFNTGMVGYPETLTDPSYCGQILILTYPLIGNYGVPENIRENGLLKFFESEKIQIKGLIVSDYSFDYSHWSAVKSLDEWLKEFQIPAIYSVDTRMLTRKLREFGTMSGKIVFDSIPDSNPSLFSDPNKTDLVSTVTTKEIINYDKGIKKLE